MEAGKATIIKALAKEGIGATSLDGKYIHLAHKTTIEVEGPSLFKLVDDGYVVAPFGDANELAGFILMDWTQRDLEIK